MSVHRHVVLKHAAVLVIALAGLAIAPDAPHAVAPERTDASADAGLAATGGETRYLNTLCDALQRRGRHPTGRDARLAHPLGSTEVAFAPDRAGRVAQHSDSTILDAMATMPVRRESIAAFPADAYAGEANHRFVVACAFGPGRMRVASGRPGEVAVR